jgi:two-component system cell cycle response regulator CtrA
MDNEAEFATCTVLLVEEDLNLALSCKSGLEAQGFRVMCTHSGREALELFAREKIDLIVSEISLPDMPGIDLIETFAACRKRIPIVANTDDFGYKQSFRSWAADAIVEKSSDAHALFTMVTTLLASPKLVH